MIRVSDRRVLSRGSLRALKRLAAYVGLVVPARASRLWLVERLARLLQCVALAACSTWATTGSLYRGPCTHVGGRPASDGVGDYAVTAQISTDWAACPRADGGMP